MEQAALVSLVAESLVQELPDLVCSAHGKVKIRGGGPNDYFHRNRTLYSSLQKRVSVQFMDNLADRVGGKASRELDRGDHYDELFTALLTAIIQAGRAESPKPVAVGSAAAPTAAPTPNEMNEIYFNDVILTPVSKLKLILNLADHRRSFLYDPVFDLCHRIDYEIVTSRMKYLLGKDGFLAWSETHTHDCFLSYRPSAPRLFKEEQAQIFNTWTDASWRKGWSPEQTADCPTELKEFMELFIADEQSRYYTLAWLRDCIFERAEPILILCGRPGAGKNTFIQGLTAGLVGHNNYRSASRGFHKSSFHNGVSQCRVFFLDEMTLTPDSRDTLKDYHNGVATIERKGIDVGDPEDIYASFALANNRPDKIQLEYTDRKFFTPILCETPLNISWGNEKISEFKEKLEDDAYLRQIASYLLHAFQPQEARKFTKNEFFRKLCINSYPSEFRAFIHACSKLPTFNSKLLAKGRRRLLNAFELKDMIDLFETQFNEPLAELTINNDSTWAAVSKVYKSPKLDETKPVFYANGNGAAHKMIPDFDEPEAIGIQA